MVAVVTVVVVIIVIIMEVILAVVFLLTSETWRVCHMQQLGLCSELRTCPDPEEKLHNMGIVKDYARILEGPIMQKLWNIFTNPKSSATSSLQLRSRQSCSRRFPALWVLKVFQDLPEWHQGLRASGYCSNSRNTYCSMK